MTAARWIALNIVGNEIYGNDPLPHEDRDEIARWMVEDDFLGWPDVEAAQATLDDWDWTEAVA